MTTIKQWHHRAMERVDDGLAARRAGDHEKARLYYDEAVEWERKAAEASTTQPSRSILFRSAAWMALEAEDPAEAERLAACGLMASDVPEKRKAELRAVAEEARMRLYTPMAPPGAAPAIFLHLEGPAIAYGQAPPSVISTRQDALIRLLVRTAERKKKKPFRQKGKSTVISDLQPKVVCEAASVVVRVALMGTEQRHMWDENIEIVREVHRCLNYFYNHDERALHSRIHDPAYLNDFRLCATELTPDEKSVTSVDVMTSISGATQSPIRLRKRIPHETLPTEKKRTQLIGFFRGADETGKSSDIIKLVERSTEKIYKIQVKNTSVEEMVRSLYGAMVRVEVVRKNRKYFMSEMPVRVHEDDDEY